MWIYQSFVSTKKDGVQGKLVVIVLEMYFDGYISSLINGSFEVT